MSNNSAIYKHGLKCFVSLVSVFSAIYLLVQYYRDIGTFIGMAISEAIPVADNALAFVLPASPSITAVCMVITLWLGCMNHKLNIDGILTDKFNKASVLCGKITVIIGFIFLLNFVFRSTSGFTALKVVLGIGWFSQMISLIVIFTNGDILHAKTGKAAKAAKEAQEAQEA